MSRVVLSIGSNLGDRLAHLRAAVDALRPWLVAVSPVYETAPWGPVPQADYLNAIVVADDPAAGPGEWLERAHESEDASGRTRDVRWGARTLDVDLIVVDDVVSDDPALTLPHPRAHERGFVLVPWAEAAPDATLGGVPIVDLRDKLPADDLAGVRLRAELGLA